MYRLGPIILKMVSIQIVQGLRGVEWVQGLFLFPLVLGKM